MHKVVIPKEELEHLYFDEDYSIRDLCKHYHHDLKTIIKLFKELGITARDSFEAWKIRKKTKTIPRISKDDLYREYIVERNSTEKISLKYEIPWRSVKRYLKKYNITPRIRYRTYDTSIELIVEDELIRREIGHYKQYSIGSITRVDKAFPEEKIAIFCDGDYWHSFPKAIEKDKRINEVLEKMGWTVLRFSEKEIKAHPQQIVDKIIEILVTKRCRMNGCASA